MRPLYCLAIALLCCAATLRAEDAKDAEEHRAQGIAALQESQTNPREVVKAARHFAKAAAIFEKLGDADGNVEMNSFLYWCKKKMNLDDIEAFTKGGEAVVTEKLKALDTQKVEKTDAQTWYDRAETFAKAKPDEHLLIAIRFFEVADRFIGTEMSVKAQRRSLDEMQLASAAKPKPAAPDEPRIGPAKPAVEAVAKTAIPDAAKLRDAEKTIKDIFKDEFAKKSADDKKALGQKLLQQANETKDDPVSRYVLLKEAAAAAAAGADAETALKALDALGQNYELDALALKADALGKILPTTADAAKALARVYLKVIDDAIAADNYDAAVKLATAADTVARKAQDMPLVTQLQARGKEVRALQTDFAKVKAAQATLKDKPDDPEANLAVGKFLCFTKGAWETGLPLLAKGNDVTLKTAASLELQNPKQAAEMESLANSWWDAGEKLPSIQKNIGKLHSLVWYERAVHSLDGLNKAKIEKRIVELVQLAKETGLCVDLIKLVQLPKNVIHGTWKMDGKELTSPSSGWARVEIPYDATAEYDLDLTFTRMDGNDAVLFFLSNSAHPFMYQFGWVGTAGFEILGGRRSNQNESTARVTFVSGQKYSINIKVRKNSSEAWMDGKRLSAFKTKDYSEVGLHAVYKMKNSNWLGVGGDNISIVFHEVLLYPKPQLIGR